MWVTVWKNAITGEYVLAEEGVTRRQDCVYVGKSFLQMQTATAQGPS